MLRHLTRAHLLDGVIEEACVARRHQILSNAVVVVELNLRRGKACEGEQTIAREQVVLECAELYRHRVAT